MSTLTTPDGVSLHDAFWGNARPPTPEELAEVQRFGRWKNHHGEERLSERVSLEVANLREATRVIVFYHYLHRGRTMAQLPYWILLDGVRVGVLLFSYPRLSVPLSGIAPMNLLELARMWLSPDVQGLKAQASDGRKHAFSVASCAIGMALRQVRRDWAAKYPDLPRLDAIVSWADLVHHEGTIYRAANFTDLGPSGGSMHGSRHRPNGGRDQMNADYAHPKTLYMFRYAKALRRPKNLLDLAPPLEATLHPVRSVTMLMEINGRKIPEPKRKKRFETNVCTSKGCQNTRDLVEWVDFGEKGKFLICPTCRAKVDGAAQAAPAAPADPHAALAASTMRSGAMAAAFAAPSPAEPAALIPPAELAVMQQDADGLYTEVKQFEVESNDDLQLAAEVLADVKGKAKRIDEMEKSATRPLNETLKTIRGWFRPAKDRFLSIELAIKNAIGRFEMAQAAKRQAAIAQLGDSATRDEAATALATLNDAQVQSVQGLSTRMVWDFIVTDPNVVPREYLTVDDSKIRHAVRAGARTIPGVSIFEKPQVASKST